MTLEEFEEHLRRTESPRTVLAYMSDAEAFESFRAGQAASVDVLEAWVDSLNHGRLNPATVSRKLSAVRRWLAFRARSGDPDAMGVLTVLNGGYQVARGPRQSDKKIVEVVTPDGYRAARAKMTGWAGALADLLYSTGARASEALGDEMAGIPHLTVRDGRALVECGHVETIGKGGKVRVLLLPSAGRAALAAWLNGREASSPLFPSPNDPTKPVSKQSFNEALHRAGLGGAHGLRHLYRSRLRQVGAPDQVVAALMGHGPRNVTDGYGIPSVEELKVWIERIE